MMNRRRGISPATAFAAGAVFMYLLDPLYGRRRRHVLRDKIGSARRHVGFAADKACEDFENRARGVLHRVSGMFRRGGADDDVIAARARSRLGRIVSHPHAVKVAARDGAVTLSGPILTDERAGLLSEMRHVRDVRHIEDHLEVHDRADIPALQGGGADALVRRRERFELAQGHWAPAARFLVGSAGCGAMLYGLLRRGTAAKLIGAGGAMALLRAATNLDARRLTGLGAGADAIEVQKVINIDAPPDEVFAFFCDVENFPHFMAHVREVKPLRGQRSHWIVRGPAGIGIEWTAVVTQCVPNTLLAWRSEEGASVQHEGVARFEPNDGGGTRVSIRIGYNPVAGAIGHALAVIFGADPKSAMDQDLVRLKSLIENGKASAAGKHFSRDEMALNVPISAS